MKGARAGLAIAMLVASLGAAEAVCPGPAVLFEDTFEAMRPTWGESTEGIKVEDGQLVVSPRSGTYAWVANAAALYDDVDACVTVTTVNAVSAEDAVVGLVFWYSDVNNFYVLEIAPNGKASVWRRQRGNWLAQIKWRDVEGVNAGDGTSNELRVTTVGSEATFYINGAKFETLTGSPPEDGQQIGFLALSPEKGAARFAFDDFRVTEP